MLAVIKAQLTPAGEDKTVRIWGFESGKELHVLRGHEDEVTSVAFSPDGKRLASGSQHTVKVWNLR